MPTIAGRPYDVAVGSDVSDRDGMYLELCEAGEPLLEVFYSDADGTMTLSAYRPALPIAVVEWAIAEGRRRLPPSR